MSLARKTLLACSMLAVFALSPALYVKADTFVIGTPNGGYFVPLGHHSAIGRAGDQYQQVYNSSLFGAGPFNIVQLGFASRRGASGLPPAPVTASFNVTIGLSTTSLTADTLGPYSTSNRGSDFLVVYSGPLSGALTLNQTFDLNIPFANQFFYDPSGGSMLLDIILNADSNFTPPEGEVAFVSDCGTLGGRINGLASTFNTSEFGHGVLGVGLVTEFTTARRQACQNQPRCCCSA